MNILYRRFLIVAAFITAMGAITANIIQETRTARTDQFNRIEMISPDMRNSCATGKICAVSPTTLVFSAVMRG